MAKKKSGFVKPVKILAAKNLRPDLKPHIGKIIKAPVGAAQDWVRAGWAQSAGATYKVRKKTEKSEVKKS